MSAIVVFGATMALFGATPALASGSAGVHTTAVTHKPDASVRVVKSKYHYPGQSFSYSLYPSWQGVGTYNTTAKHQTAKADFQYNCCDETHTFSISIRNNGGAGDRFTVHATGSGLAGWAVTYFHGTTNITSAVVGGTYTTPTLASGGQFLLTAKLVGSAASETLAGSRLVTVASFADGTKKDAVKLRLEEAAWCFC